MNLWINNFIWFFVLISLCGNFFIIKKNILGFYLWLLADVFLIVHNFYIQEFAQSVLYIIYTIFCIYGILKWGDNDKKQ